MRLFLVVCLFGIASLCRSNNLKCGFPLLVVFAEKKNDSEAYAWVDIIYAILSLLFMPFTYLLLINYRGSLRVKLYFQMWYDIIFYNDHSAIITLANFADITKILPV